MDLRAGITSTLFRYMASIQTIKSSKIQVLANRAVILGVGTVVRGRVKIRQVFSFKTFVDFLASSGLLLLVSVALKINISD